eukprot:GHVS01007860.1.p1 GENE.GHVS01007860.1~~GHVS01007860.1.p1  ORF type:complete len:477 (+),score=56.33 GHVS01007860.1:173-1432(+)
MEDSLSCKTANVELSHDMFNSSSLCSSLRYHRPLGTFELGFDWKQVISNRHAATLGYRLGSGVSSVSCVWAAQSNNSNIPGRLKCRAVLSESDVRVDAKGELQLSPLEEPSNFAVWTEGDNWWTVTGSRICLRAGVGAQRGVESKLIWKFWGGQRTKFKYGLLWSPEGLSLIFGFTRGGVSYQLPIELTDSVADLPLKSTVCLALLVLVPPVVISVAGLLTTAVLSQLRHCRREQSGDAEVEKKMLEEVRQFVERRDVAIQEQAVLDKSSKGRVAVENSRHGLVIEEAFYGHPSYIHRAVDRAELLMPTTPSEAVALSRQTSFWVTDVTAALASRVTNSQLCISTWTKRFLIGFCYPYAAPKPTLVDSSVSSPKLSDGNITFIPSPTQGVFEPVLLIRYRYKQQTHVKQLSDIDAVVLP